MPRPFTEPDAEAAFQTQYRKSGLQFAVAAFTLGAVSVLVFLVVVAATNAPSSLDAERQTLRLSFALTLLASAWVCRYRQGWVLSYYVPAILLLMLISGGTVVLLVVLADSQVFGPNIGLGRVPMAMLLVLWVGYSFQRLPIQLAVPVLAAPSLFLIAEAWSLSDRDSAVSLTLYAAVAHTVGIILSIQVERRERAVFAHARDLERANAEIAAQSKRNADLSAEKSLVLASVSHDLRQPLSSLSLYINMLRTAAPAPDAGEVLRCAAQMQTCVSAMEGNLGRILEISRMQNRDARLPVGPVDLRAMFAGLRTIFSPGAAAAGIRLEIKDPTLGALMVRSHRERLHDAISNLVSNAIKFSDSSRGRGCWVHVGAVRTARGVRIDVRDNGIGIGPEHHSKVFDEYYQIDNPARNSTQGYGLGLSVVRATVGRLAGHATGLYSRLGHGSRFSVYVPIAERGEEPEATGSPLDDKTIADRSEATLLGSLVLVVEDDDSLREALAEQLGSWGVVVETASTCAEAIATVRQSERLIDAILTDFKLPGGESGIDVIRQVRASQPHQVAAVLTSGEYSFDRTLLANMESVRFLPKPIEPHVLRMELTNAIQTSLEAATRLE